MTAKKKFSLEIYLGFFEFRSEKNNDLTFTPLNMLVLNQTINEL